MGCAGEPLGPLERISSSKQCGCYEKQELKGLSEGWADPNGQFMCIVLVAFLVYTGKIEFLFPFHTRTAGKVFNWVRLLCLELGTHTVSCLYLLGRKRAYGTVHCGDDRAHVTAH